MAATYPRIPYGEADIRRIRLRGWLYVDKTRFLRRLEEESYAFLIRPRRFGKSLWVSVLENYYDRTRADEWRAVFDGTDIGRQPTEDRSRYVILRFNFSAFDDTLETLRERFETYCLIEIRAALERNADLFPNAVVRRILAHSSVDGKLRELFRYAGDHGIPLYGLIDEYDNFANTVLAHHGREAYGSFTHGGGFYRSFFAALKAGAAESGGGLERLFITGVSPITMDDVTSGFNIGTNVSLGPQFNDLLGFTEEEVRDLLKLYRDCGALDQEVDAALAVMHEWYDGYRFARGAQGDLYNTYMVLYYLKHSVPNQPPPDELIDVNVRIDYGKLRHLLVANREAGVRFNGNFDLLRNIAGEGGADADVNLSFPLEDLVEPENFLSLLYYFGLLSIRGASQGRTRLGIPNQTVRRLMYGYPGDRHGLPRRVAAGAGVPRRGHRGADRHPRLPGRREGGAGLPGGVLQPDRPLPDPLRARAQQGLRRPAPGAVPHPLPRRPLRLRAGDQVPEARRGSGHGCRGGAAAGGADATAELPG